MKPGRKESGFARPAPGPFLKGMPRWTLVPRGSPPEPNSPERCPKGPETRVPCDGPERSPNWARSNGKGRIVRQAVLRRIRREDEAREDQERWRKRLDWLNRAYAKRTRSSGRSRSSSRRYALPRDASSPGERDRTLPVPWRLKSQNANLCSRSAHRTRAPNARTERHHVSAARRALSAHLCGCCSAQDRRFGRDGLDDLCVVMCVLDAS
jgi:hypothetical protein